MKFNTIDQLKEFAKTMPVEKTYQVGAGHHNHSRAVYQIGAVQILIDTMFPHNVFKPTQEWYWTGDGFSKAQAELYAKQYNAKVEEAYYSDDENNEYQLIFDDLNNLLQWVFDNRKKDLEYVK